MSDNLTPEQLTPAGWNPDEWADVNSWHSGREKTKLVTATILHAAYYPEKETLAVHVKREDGREAVSYLPKSALRFNGQHHLDLSKEETDRQMEKTADLFLRRKGAKIRLRVFED